MITPEQREERRKYIGSSECAAVCGFDPFASAADVWLVKTGRAEDFEGNEATARGNLLEPAVIKWMEARCGMYFKPSVMKVSPCGYLACNFDGINEEERAIAEAKTSVDETEWGEEGTDAVPPRVLCQTHHQLHIAGPEYRTAYVGLLVPAFKQFEFRMYVVERNDELCEEIAARCRDFMVNHVLADVPPTDFRPSMEVLKRIVREPGKVIDLMDVQATAAINQWQDLAAKRLEFEKAEEVAKATVIGLIGDAEAANTELGLLSYKQYFVKACERAAYDYRKLALKKLKR